MIHILFLDGKSQLDWFVQPELIDLNEIKHLLKALHELWASFEA